MELFGEGEFDRSLAEQQTKGGLLELAREEYHALLDQFIAPVRRSYTMADLGPRRFRFAFECSCECTDNASGKAASPSVELATDVVRADFEIRNLRGAILRCSLWRAMGPLRGAGAASNPDCDADADVDTAGRPGLGDASESRPCVVLIHDYGCARVDSLPLLAPCLAAGCDVCAFDCAGAGHSTGQYCSLGWYEREDVALVVAHLRDKLRPRAAPIALWGRGIGAAAALLATDEAALAADATSPADRPRKLPYTLHLVPPENPHRPLDLGAAFDSASFFSKQLRVRAGSVRSQGLLPEALARALASSDNGSGTGAPGAGSSAAINLGADAAAASGAIRPGDVLMGIGPDAVRPKSQKELVKFLTRCLASPNSDRSSAPGVAAKQFTAISLYRHHVLAAEEASRLMPAPYGMGARLGLGPPAVHAAGPAAEEVGTDALPGVSALVLDSPFGSVYELAWDMVALAKKETDVYVPSLLIKAALAQLRSSIKKRVLFDLFDVRPAAHISDAAQMQLARERLRHDNIAGTVAASMETPATGKAPKMLRRKKQKQKQEQKQDAAAPSQTPPGRRSQGLYGVPALFAWSNANATVLPVRSQEVFTSYCGPKARVDLGPLMHEAARPRLFLAQASAFLRQALGTGAELYAAAAAAAAAGTSHSAATPVQRSKRTSAATTFPPVPWHTSPPLQARLASTDASESKSGNVVRGPLDIPAPRLLQGVYPRQRKYAAPMDEGTRKRGQQGQRNRQKEEEADEKHEDDNEETGNPKHEQRKVTQQASAGDKGSARETETTRAAANQTPKFKLKRKEASPESRPTLAAGGGSFWAAEEARLQAEQADAKESPFSYSLRSMSPSVREYLTHSSTTTDQLGADLESQSDGQHTATSNVGDRGSPVAPPWAFDLSASGASSEYAGWTPAERLDRARTGRAFRRSAGAQVLLAFRMLLLLLRDSLSVLRALCHAAAAALHSLDGGYGFGFDVDSEHVHRRMQCVLTLLPASIACLGPALGGGARSYYLHMRGFFNARCISRGVRGMRDEPDLYGPVWLAATLVFVGAIAGCPGALRVALDARDSTAACTGLDECGHLIIRRAAFNLLRLFVLGCVVLATGLLWQRLTPFSRGGKMDGTGADDMESDEAQLLRREPATRGLHDVALSDSDDDDAQAIHRAPGSLGPHPGLLLSALCVSGYSLTPIVIIVLAHAVMLLIFHALGMSPLLGVLERIIVGWGSWVAAGAAAAAATLHVYWLLSKWSVSWNANTTSKGGRGVAPSPLHVVCMSLILGAAVGMCSVILLRADMDLCPAAFVATDTMSANSQPSAAALADAVKSARAAARQAALNAAAVKSAARTGMTSTPPSMSDAAAVHDAPSIGSVLAGGLWSLAYFVVKWTFLLVVLLLTLMLVGIAWDRRSGRLPIHAPRRGAVSSRTPSFW